MQNSFTVFIYNIYFCKCQRADQKKSKEDKQTLEEINSANRRSQAKCQLVKNSYIKQIKLFLFFPYNNLPYNNLVCMEES